MHLRLDEELKRKMEEYVVRHSTNLNAVTSMLFNQLLATEEATKYEAEQI